MKKTYVMLSFFITAFVSVLAVIIILLRGQVFPVLEISDSIEIIRTSKNLLYNISLMFCYILPFFSFFAVYSLLKQNNQMILGFWGFMFCLFGTALALPALGFFTFAFPEIVKIESIDNSAVQTLIENMVLGPSLIVGIVSAVFYSAGPVLLGIGLIRIKKKNALAAILFGFHGLMLSFGFSFLPVLLAGWIMLGISVFLLGIAAE